MEDEIIKANIPLIKKIAAKFYNVSYEDLFQSGCIGVLKAYNNYRKDGKTKFSTYAYDYIFGEMYDFVLKNQKIKISKDMLRLAKKILQAKNELSLKLHRQVSSLEVSQFLGLSSSLVSDVYMATKSFLSLDSKENERDVYDLVYDNKDVSLDEKLTLKDGIMSLDECEQKIILYRYFNDMTQSEIARKLNMTQVKVSRYEKKSLEKLRGYYEVT